LIPQLRSAANGHDRRIASIIIKTVDDTVRVYVNVPDPHPYKNKMTLYAAETERQIFETNDNLLGRTFPLIMAEIAERYKYAQDSDIDTFVSVLREDNERWTTKLEAARFEVLAVI
jgi:hypothetical protein